MAVSIRRIEADDAAECGRICYEAFTAIATAHNFPPDMPSPEFVAGVVMPGLIASQNVFGIVAQDQHGKLLGSSFLHEADAISGIGPITVDPQAQNAGVGTALMAAALERSAQKGFAGCRLVQAAYHCRSLSLYTKLGFSTREPLSCFQGPAIGETLAGYAVRAVTAEDAAACDALCARIHGADRKGELRSAIAAGTARLVERAGRVTGYTTAIAFFAHSVAETNDDLMALIGAAEAFGGPGFLVPTRNGELMRWCLGKGLKITQPMTLMSMGLYNEPAGAFLPSVIY
ncbi:MAG TPA: GNAT family N-acetyltransferase [Caulobacteraceae bacterium]|nr:GNAT family N-acetyltransferase [Caulobacteraceae bacterium]